MKINCWEFKDCGREPGGKNIKQLGVCPASTDDSLNGVHDGTNSGRACWIVAGTFCEGKVQGTFAKKYEDCTKCDFFKLVRKEEGKNYKTSLSLLKKLKVLR